MRCENCKDTLCSFRLTAGECRADAVKITNAIVCLTTRGWTCITPGGIDIKKLSDATRELIESVEGYVCPKKGDRYVFRNEALAKCNELKKMLDEGK